MRSFAKITVSLAIVSTAFCTSAQAAREGRVKDTVLLHGAFFGRSRWKGIVDILSAEDYAANIVQPSETAPADDVAGASRGLDPASLVGHSYSGAIKIGVGNNESLKTLVYAAVFQPDVGERLGSLDAKMPRTGTAVAPSPDSFLFIDRKKFRADLSADVNPAVADLTARSQVPLSIEAAGTPATAWKIKPIHAIGATQDRSINPDLDRFTDRRSGSVTSDTAASHAVYISQSKAVAVITENGANGTC